MQKVLLTGAISFIGRGLIESLVEKSIQYMARQHIEETLNNILM
ncbi:MULTISPECIES: hypothetical protein [Clostridium]|nr:MULTISPECIES: hypothetical protein [Clostridium]MDU1401662.1 hypothetical protein [Clostridium sp.]MDU1601456.1 hypothetical protein [Clostridium sp.]MDU2894615.1 hypothetical protein [Clostridium sp.]MDU3006474.1 hypothetical protein [Clostridium sp.]MDU3037342.1 hypothetical protein [Clostridium sp.]